MTVLARTRIPIAALVALLLLAALALSAPRNDQSSFKNPWSEGRFALLQALALPQTRRTEAPASAQSALGHALFFDTALNPDKELGCVSCHQGNRAFSDGKKHPANNPQRRNTPGLIGIAQSHWFFWDGRKDSLWSQTLEPLYAEHEIALDAEQLFNTLGQSPRYRHLYQSAYGEWPQVLPSASSAQGQLLQARIGLALAAFIAELQHQPSPYDLYIQALQNKDPAAADKWLSPDQRAGLEVMLRSNCLGCHRGAAFSDRSFHNIGTGESDLGRAQGKLLRRADAFNCDSEVAATIGKECNTDNFGESEIPRLLKGAFKTPSLRQLTHTAPYMHDGRYQSIEEVIEHYRHPPESVHGLANIQAISDGEASQLAEFLRALSSPINSQAWYNKAP